MGLGIFTIKFFCPSKYILKGNDSWHSSQTKGFQEMMIAALDSLGLIVLLNHYWIHLIWIYLADPEHLHGAIKGLSNYPSSRQTRHMSFYYYYGGLNPSDFSLVIVSYTLYLDLIYMIYYVDSLSSKIIYLTLTFCFPILTISPSLSLYFLEGKLLRTSHNWLAVSLLVLTLGLRTYLTFSF